MKIFRKTKIIKRTFFFGTGSTKINYLKHDDLVRLEFDKNLTFMDKIHIFDNLGPFLRMPKVFMLSLYFVKKREKVLSLLTISLVIIKILYLQLLK